jgi:large conductance mechanosensitive channel
VFKEFKEFAMRGNVLDMAVGIIIGAAFGKIINSMVEDVMMPPLGVLLGGVDFSNLFIGLTGQQFASLAEAKAAGAATLNYGIFLNTIINFMIVAFSVFMLVKGVNRLKRKEAVAPTPTPTEKPCPYCYSMISIKATKCAHCTSTVPAAA